MSSRLTDSQARALAVGLREKYATLIALREAHARGEPAPPKETFRALVARYPGALRELDQRRSASLQQRLGELGDVLDGGAPLPAWAIVQARYHGFLRSALQLKRRMARTTDPLAVGRHWLASAAGQSQRAPDEPPVGFWNDKRLQGLMCPPNGRLSALVALWVAEHCDISEHAVRRILFPSAADAGSVPICE